MKTKSALLRQTDVWLMIVFPITLLSGLLVHTAMHPSSSVPIKPMLGLHILSSIVFLIFSIKHVCQHWGWYRMLMNGKGCSTVTIMLSFLYALECSSGIVLTLQKSESITEFGLAHYFIGILFSVFAIWHIIIRFKLFRKLKKG